MHATPLVAIRVYGALVFDSSDPLDVDGEDGWRTPSAVNWPSLLAGLVITPSKPLTTYELIVIERLDRGCRVIQQGGRETKLRDADVAGRTTEVRPETRQRALLRRTYELIEERLSDPELSPGRLAAALYISVRSLHNLFESEQTTVADWIRQRRLERCAHDLLDPALAGKPIGTIGARWGITNQAHFSRLFRARYGASPSAFRATMHAQS
jgi:AraC-like DNA-binding protein